ncbi:GNAT family N-acetyltransferase [Chryseobacterium sp. NRRL B-14859]|uniref:GNAT family N-acetyltransferase n=1 Tax=Chryseobacterium sp. NRRL B-14859 TaxID=1562763 RepID=UPI003398AC52
MIIRKGTHGDLQEMQQLFTDTVITVCKKDYNNAQLEAWKSGAENKERWEKVIQDQFVLVALSHHRIVGFCTLEKGNYIDFLFVHKEYQHQGIAQKLYKQIEEEALRQKQPRLTAEVSKTAKSFFEKAGFHVVTEQTVIVKGVGLINYTMEKKLI